jgi:hypothetical protein
MLSVGSSENVEMDLDDVTAQLLALPLDQFTAARNARVKELKAAGQRELAADVATLKKPPVHLWAANQVARSNPALMRKLRDAAAEVTRTQTGKSATARDLRTASAGFQNALDAGVNAAADRLGKDSHAVTEEAERRIREILRMAVMEGGAAWEQLQKGALITEPTPGDDVLTMFQAGVHPPPRASPAKREADRDPHVARAAERTARMDAERAEQLEVTARRLRAEADEAGAQAKRADERARAAEKEAAEARAQAKKSARASGARRD